MSAALLDHLGVAKLSQVLAGPAEPQEQAHLATCLLCRLRVNDLRLTRALLGSLGEADHSATQLLDGPVPASVPVPLDAETLAAYHDEALPADEMAAIDRRLLTDDQALAALIELRIALYSPRPHVPPPLTASAVAAFGNGARIALTSLGTLTIDWHGTTPSLTLDALKPEQLARGLSSAADDHRATWPQVPPEPFDGRPAGAAPPAAELGENEVTLNAGFLQIRLRVASAAAIELFVFDEARFEPAHHVQLRLEMEDTAARTAVTGAAGKAILPLSRGSGRLIVDNGQSWVLEIR